MRTRAILLVSVFLFTPAFISISSAEPPSFVSTHIPSALELQVTSPPMKVAVILCFSPGSGQFTAAEADRLAHTAATVFAGTFGSVIDTFSPSRLAGLGFANCGQVDAFAQRNYRPFGFDRLVLVDSFKLTWPHLAAAGTLAQFDAYVDDGSGGQPYAASVLFPLAFLSLLPATAEPLGSTPSDSEAAQPESMFWRWLLSLISAP